MDILKATKRTTASTGQINKLRYDGFIPAVLYGGKKNNLNISLKKLHLQDLIRTETFTSKVFDLDIDGSPEKALPRDISYDPVSDEPIHIDFIRIAKEMNIHPMRISKYCFSSFNLDNSLKQNRFKEKQIFINKIINN